MPLATIHLLALSPSTSLPSYLHTLYNSVPRSKILITSKVIRWIITPTTIDAQRLLNPKSPWTLLLILLGTDPLPASLTSDVLDHWTSVAGIPSRLTADFARTNDHLLHPKPEAIPALTGSLGKPRVGTTSQTLELSPGLLEWATSFRKTRAGSSPLSMLNLLAFKEGMKPSYLKYGAAFAESIGKRRGGVAKLVGNIVVDASGNGGTGGNGGKWDEFALASYPSVLHFADMLAGEDYQGVNLTYRVPALEDTLILCTSEIEVEGILEAEGKGQKAKL
ncbi:hypothetical protein G647_10022 [Cladophialophora carrionii CBS 160.54]|uniref:Uncharacterized protein n=1 Tax=Cladophialophora carrionii CBS 160.54 TaxID=1279043 RepID=V9DKU6_9EURO|nr:uncharacterized protein G647_10022 [Cladophialophora carrionii CBS 160.54]ETI26923.1 hypothetical protein G647_10022 [Cladophialophora carrionii CBS 160.54]